MYHNLNWECSSGETAYSKKFRSVPIFLRISGVQITCITQAVMTAWAATPEQNRVMTDIDGGLINKTGPS
jgi:hypothetical protein